MPNKCILYNNQKLGAFTKTLTPKLEFCSTLPRVEFFTSLFVNIDAKLLLLLTKMINFGRMFNVELQRDFQ